MWTESFSRRAYNAIARATLGVVSVKFWNFSVALARGVHTKAKRKPWPRQLEVVAIGPNCIKLFSSFVVDCV